MSQKLEVGGEGTRLSKPYRYVPPQTVRFLPRFGLKTGIDFANFGLESGGGFEQTTRVYERIYRFLFQMNKKATFSLPTSTSMIRKKKKLVRIRNEF